MGIAVKGAKSGGLPTGSFFGRRARRKLTAETADNGERTVILKF